MRNSYIQYQEFDEGTWQKHVYDLYNIPLQQYLEKYHSKIPLESKKEWDKWQDNYVSLAFDESKHLEMVNNFGLSSIEVYDFSSQKEVYQLLEDDERMDEEMKKFIGFMAGNHFFEKQTVTQWFESYYWTRPEVEMINPEAKNNFTINEVLTFPYGLNYLKGVLIGLNFWRR